MIIISSCITQESSKISQLNKSPEKAWLQCSSAKNLHNLVTAMQCCIFYMNIYDEEFRVSLLKATEDSIKLNLIESSPKNGQDRSTKKQKEKEGKK